MSMTWSRVGLTYAAFVGTCHLGKSRRPVVCVSMGNFATALFWATELVFAQLCQGEIWRYVRTALGLGTGHSIKYCLGRRFVFVRTA
jgi:hypothetical protein